jgi:hypothetical protein
MGGTPEAKAIPRQSGNAISDTLNPDNKSDFQYFFKASIPSTGVEVDLRFIVFRRNDYPVKE